ncbi:hypothetical protein AWENTII_009985 [Aspergillus wentii]
MGGLRSHKGITCFPIYSFEYQYPIFQVVDVTGRTGTVHLQREDAFRIQQAHDLEGGSPGWTGSWDDMETGDEVEEGTVRAVRQDQIDASLVRSWVDNCIGLHGHYCQEGRSKTPRDKLQIEGWFIDVQEKRLVRRSVPGDPETPYIALSYVWGQSQMLQTVRSNLAEFQSPGALGSLVPRVVSDAMALVEAIGDRYLWVDAFCIVQDDPTKNEQLQIMDLIYMRARLTIVAMAGADADSGLPGVVPRTRLGQPVEIIDNCTFLARLPDLHDEMHTSRYFTRGWTYQEMMLSRRCLFVSSYQVYFRCNRAVRAEDFDAATSHESDSSTCLIREGSNEDFISHYERYVEAYTKRNLTYDSDIINAFTGILQGLSATHGVRFYAAMPIWDNIFRALLWCTTASAPSRRSLVNEQSPGVNYPSWSWIGWKGPVIYPVFGFMGRCTVHGLLPPDSIKMRDSGQIEFNRIGNIGQSKLLHCGSNECFISRWHSTDDTGRSNTNNSPDKTVHLSILQFSASTVMTSEFRLGRIGLVKSIDFVSATEKQISLLPIYDRKGQTCGAFYNPATSTFTSDQIHRLRIIAVSFCKKGMLYMTHYIHGAYRKASVGCKCLLNIMLIKSHGEVAERVAIGYMHPKAWEDATPRLETINLA